MSFKPSVVIDFDGTLVDHEYPAVGKIKAGAKEALLAFRALGYYIIISSCRTCHWHYEVFGGEGIPVKERPAVTAMVKCLDDNEIPYDEIDFGDKGKPLGTYYIDDRSISFQDNWHAIAQFVIKDTLKP